MRFQKPFWILYWRDGLPAIQPLLVFIPSSTKFIASILYSGAKALIESYLNFSRTLNFTRSFANDQSDNRRNSLSNILENIFSYIKALAPVW